MIRRSECRCACHRSRGMVHVVACCIPDEMAVDPRPGAVVCARCSAVVAAWRVAEAGGICHCCGEPVDQVGARP